MCFFYRSCLDLRRNWVSFRWLVHEWLAINVLACFVNEADRNGLSREIFKCNPVTRGRGWNALNVAHTGRDRTAEIQAEVRSAIRVLHGWCPRPPQGHRGDTVLMSPQSQMRGNHRNGGPTQQPPPATVVVSSTSSMRPPPPPPPPRARASNEGKGHHEEPTSSIPDLGEF